MKLTSAKVKLAGLIAALTAMTTPLAARAITLLPPCTESGDCGVTDILVVFVNVAEFLLGITGAVALLFFVYGGFTLLTSAGRSDEVEKGKTIIRNAVIGIAIIFLSGVIVRFTSEALTGGEFAEDFKVVGESCTKNGQAGLYVTIPAGFTNPQDPSGTFVEEEILCIAKDDCQDLNATLTSRNRPEGGMYDCVRTDYQEDDGNRVRGCARGLCRSRGSDFACCLCENADGELIPCPNAAK